MRIANIAMVWMLLLASAACSSSSTSPSSNSTGNSAVTSLTIVGNGQIDLLNTTSSLVALAVRANGSTNNVTASAAWQSSNPTAITVSSTGVLTGLDVGAATITVSYQGQSATLASRVGARIDCSSYIPTSLTVLATENAFTVAAPLQGGYELLDGYSSEANAQVAVAVFQRYRNYCSVGRDNGRSDRLAFIFSYWLNQFGLSTTIANEDCEAYDPKALQITSKGSAGWSLAANGREFFTTDTAADATTLLAMMKGYSNQCYIGRSTESRLHRYWK